MVKERTMAREITDAFNEYSFFVLCFVIAGAIFLGASLIVGGLFSLSLGTGPMVMIKTAVAMGDIVFLATAIGAGLFGIIGGAVKLIERKR